jgi:hypothetical protein
VDAATSQASVDALGGADKSAFYCQRPKPGGTGISGQGKQAKTGSNGQGRGSEPPPSTASKQGREEGGGPPPSSGGGNPRQGGDLRHGAQVKTTDEPPSVRDTTWKAS